MRIKCTAFVTGGTAVNLAKTKSIRLLELEFWLRGYIVCNNVNGQKMIF